jgi:hypothetical protein
MGLLLVLAGALLALSSPEASALILGGEGNMPLRDPGWPKGAEPIFNVQARIAWWEGPPFGGGQWHAECRGDAKALSAVLADFAKLDVKAKRVVLHDGTGHSFWLNPNNAAAKREAAQMDWRFMVWQPDNWKRLRRLPPDVNPTDPADADNGPPAQIEVYTGGNVKWADVVVPKGFTIVDQRLEAHGFTPADGVVLDGKVTDLATKKPLAAMVRLESLQGQKQVVKVAADPDGHWVLTKAPAGSHRVVIEAAGYVPRIVGYVNVDEQPRWQAFDGGLARPATVAGRVIDEAGQPLAEVDVRIGDVTADTGTRYESPAGYTVKTGADGRFRAEQVPVGKATVSVYKPGYVRPGLGQPITAPNQDLELSMLKAARVVVTVDFGGIDRKGGYVVSIEPEGGEAVGKYGGSGNINDKNQMTFDHVPPGRYVFRGRPNPGSDDQRTDPATVELKGGKTTEIKLTAK